MKHLKIFIDLTRLNKPIGFMLLFWPCAWGLTLAYDFSKNLNDYFFYLSLFFLGSVLMRSAGCILNDIVDKDFDKKVQRTKHRPIASGKISISEAEIVVSAGRGLKGPENWGMIEELADALGAATACSKPVSDIGWRPHSEHVGQTGITVTSDLYIAIGISGAIQHLAGVNSSKVMVVINTDPEAPFFKAADYGIVGDAFEVIPELIQKLKEFKSSNN